MHSIKDIVKQLIGKSLDAYNTKYTKVLNTRIDNIVAQAGNDNTEIVDARIDSAGVTHTTLNNRILAETKMNDEQLIEYTGSNISAEDTTQGYLKDVEILGNTIQNEEDLSDIKSVGKLQEDGTYKMSILSCGKNLWGFFNTSLDCYTEGLIQPAYYGKFIKVKPNTTYTIKCKPITITSGNWIVVNISNSSKSKFEVLNQCQTGDSNNNSNNVGTITTLEDGLLGISVYVYDFRNISHWQEFINLPIQLEEGTVATPYEPYQENKCDILLPCQLEKVGDVSDRLYYDDVEKAWCIEKNIGEVVLNGSESWGVRTDIPGNTTHLYFQSENLLNFKNNICVCDKFTFKKDAEFNIEYIRLYVFGDNQYAGINIANSKLTSQDVEGFKTWLSQNPTLVKYQLATPQKIVLPLDVQIQLNSFFGTTHIYMESGEVEGTIKCKIPKSLGATVQSLNNKTDILSDRIEAIEGLKDSQNMKYETDKGYLVCKETKNGVIDDLKIEGKTLVNKMPNNTNNKYFIEIDSQALNQSTAIQYTNLEVGKEYTIISDIDTTNFKMAVYKNGGSDFIIPYKNSNMLNFTVPTDATDIRIYIICQKETIGLTRINFMMLEGDHTQNPPSYFEGLMSVGQDVDEIEVLSRKEDGNLFDADGLTYGRVNSLVIGKYYNEVYLKSNNAQSRVIGLPVRLPQNSNLKFYFKCEGYQIAHAFFDKNLRLVRDSSWHSNAIAISRRGGEVYLGSYIRRDDNAIMSKSDIEYIKQNATIIASNNFESIVYTPHQSDKKQILFYNSNGELEPIQELHEWDSIEKHSDNKWYYHKRSGKVVLNGSENWKEGSPSQFTDTHMFFACNSFDNLIKTEAEVISDKFVYGVTWDMLSRECIDSATETSKLRIRISKSKLSTQDVQGFKQWLQTNNVTVVYQLAQEEVYELAPLHLDSYANETLILCNSGAISPKMEFSITSHINELVKTYGERINLLEEKVYKYMIVQNRIQLTSMYNSDSVAFKVNHTTYSEDIIEYNEDLYNLILENILVGKDNYNIDKMSNLILDYASWSQITWEQYDILISLMKIQHNPIIEEDGDIDAIN